MKKTILPLKWFTNREIIVWGVITGIYWLVLGFHWFGLASGVVIGFLVMWIVRGAINGYRVKPYVKRLFGVKKNGY